MEVALLVEWREGVEVRDGAVEAIAHDDAICAICYNLLYNGESCETCVASLLAMTDNTRTNSSILFS
jgi:hypothetical protein